MLLQITPKKEDVIIARFAALAIGIHVIESILPSPFPGIKPGFANIVTLLVFMAYGFNAAAWVSMLRVVVGSLIIGTFLSPTFVLSMSGAVASLFVLYGIHYFNMMQSTKNNARLSIFSIAILMSMAHMATQVMVVYLLFIPHNALFDILPVMMTMALIFGAINGIIAHKAFSKIIESKKTETTKEAVN